MDEDISKNTIMVLVVLTIIISLLGTWTVVNEASKIRGFQDSGSVLEEKTTTQGRVSINIEKAPEPVSATGKVSLIIDRSI